MRSEPSCVICLNSLRTSESLCCQNPRQCLRYRSVPAKLVSNDKTWCGKMGLQDCVRHTSSRSLLVSSQFLRPVLPLWDFQVSPKFFLLVSIIVTLLLPRLFLIFVAIELICGLISSCLVSFSLVTGRSLGRRIGEMSLFVRMNKRGVLTKNWTVE